MTQETEIVLLCLVAESDMTLHVHINYSLTQHVESHAVEMAWVKQAGTRSVLSNFVFTGKILHDL